MTPWGIGEATSANHSLWNAAGSGPSRAKVVADGTGYGMNSETLPGVSGKTGTAEDSSSHGEDNFWFASYAPSDNPEIVVVAFATNTPGGCPGLAHSQSVDRGLLQSLTPIKPLYAHAAAPSSGWS